MTVQPLNITLPTVHLNGSSKQSLLDCYFDAAEALRKALVAVQATAPHGRDYYVQRTHDGEHVTHRAIAEHVDRLKRLESVLRELNALALHVCDQEAR